MWSERLVKNLVPIYLNLASGSTSRAEAGGLGFAPQPETVLAERGQVGLRSSFSPADGGLLFLHGRTLWAPGQDMERNASSFVIRVTNGTGSVRQFASKAARCEARAAFELSDQPPRFGGAGLRSEMFLLGSPEAVTAAKATRNAVIRSWILAASGKEKKAPPGDHPSLARLSSLP